MPYDFETLEAHFFMRADAGLTPRDRDLVFHGVDAVKIGQQKPPLRAAAYDHAVALHVKLRRRIDILRLAEHVDVDLKERQFRRPDG